MPAENYYVVKDGAPVNVVRWDGDASRWRPPSGHTASKVSEWAGPPLVERLTTADVNRRTIDETLAQLVVMLGQDRDRLAGGSATAAQKDAALLRCVRAVRLMARVQLAQLDGTD